MRASVRALALLLGGGCQPMAFALDGIVNPADPAGPARELHVARLAFAHGTHSTRGPGRPWWRIDWPEAEASFLDGVSRHTAIDVAADSAHVTLRDEALFDYPWLFAQQVGHWALGDGEVGRLREYLLRGGFLVIDDFHGRSEWEVFAGTMERVLPGHRVVGIAEDDPLLHVFHDLDQRTQIPGRRHIVGRDTDGAPLVRMPHAPPRWLGLRDTNGRLLVVINFNMDMGDAWEHADDPYYPIPMTTLAYRFGINYLLYAMTH